MDPAVQAFFDAIGDDNRTAIARRVGVTPQAIHYWEKGKSPNIGNIRAALNAVGMDLAVVDLGSQSCLTEI